MDASRSAPEQNAVPSAASTTTRTAGSSSAWSSASPSSRSVPGGQRVAPRGVGQRDGGDRIGHGVANRGGAVAPWISHAAILPTGCALHHPAPPPDGPRPGAASPLRAVVARPMLVAAPAPASAPAILAA